jgi:hypothetical protein
MGRISIDTVTRANYCRKAGGAIAIVLDIVPRLQLSVTRSNWPVRYVYHFIMRGVSRILTLPHPNFKDPHFLAMSSPQPIVDSDAIDVDIEPVHQYPPTPSGSQTRVRFGLFCKSAFLLCLSQDNSSTGPDRHITMERHSRLRVTGIQNAFMETFDRLAASIDSKAIPSLSLLRGPSYVNRQRLRAARIDHNTPAGASSNPQSQQLLQYTHGTASQETQSHQVLQHSNNPTTPSMDEQDSHPNPNLQSQQIPQITIDQATQPVDEQVPFPNPQSHQIPNPNTDSMPLPPGVQDAPPSHSAPQVSNNETALPVYGQDIPPNPRSHQTPTDIEPSLYMDKQDPPPNPQSQQTPTDNGPSPSMNVRDPLPNAQVQQTPTANEPSQHMDGQDPPNPQVQQTPRDNEPSQPMDGQDPSPSPQVQQVPAANEPSRPMDGQDPPPNPQSHQILEPTDPQPNAGGIPSGPPLTNSQMSPERHPHTGRYRLQNPSHYHQAAFQPPTFENNPFLPEPGRQADPRPPILEKRHRDQSPQGRASK